MVKLTKIVTGKIDPLIRGKNVPQSEWKYLLAARRSYCNQQFQDDCRELLLFIDDGRENKFFGYHDEETYWREGLWLEPEAVPFAENYLRARKARLEAGIDGRDWREIAFDQAVTLGKRGRPKKGKEKVGNTNISKGGSTRAYILARLDRDGHAELAARVRAGEMSANAAAIAAGYRKASTQLEKQLKGLPKLTPTELRQLRARIDELLAALRCAA